MFLFSFLRFSSSGAEILQGGISDPKQTCDQEWTSGSPDCRLIGNPECVQRSHQQRLWRWGDWGWPRRARGKQESWFSSSQLLTHTAAGNPASAALAVWGRREERPPKPRASFQSALDGKKGLEEEDCLGESLESCQDNLEVRLNVGNHHVRYSETILCETGNAHVSYLLWGLLATHFKFHVVPFVIPHSL